MEHALVGAAEHAMALSAVALGAGQDLLVPPVRRDAALYSTHVVVFLLVGALLSRQHPSNGLCLRLGNWNSLSERNANRLSLLAPHVVAAAVHTHDLAAACYAEARGSALFGL